MSGNTKFASITSALLARKGEARPWRGLEGDDEEPMPFSWHAEEVRAAGAVLPSPPQPAKDKSCAVHMSPHDFERLGILAVKTGISRHQLLKQALAEFLEARAKEYGCACLGACNSNCGEGC